MEHKKFYNYAHEIRVDGKRINEELEKEGYILREDMSFNILGIKNETEFIILKSNQLPTRDTNDDTHSAPFRWNVSELSEELKFFSKKKY